MAIGFYPFVKRFIVTGWSLGDFLFWLPQHPSVLFPDVPTVAEYWKRNVFSGLFKPSIAALDPDLTIPHLYHTPPLYPGRTAEYTYTARFQLFDPEIGEYEERFVTTLSDTVMTREEVLDWAEARVESDPERYGDIFGDFELHTAEWKERKL